MRRALSARGPKMEPLVPRFTGTQSSSLSGEARSGTLKTRAVKILQVKRAPPVRSTRTPSPPPPKAAADSDVSSNGSSSDDENTANHQARRSSVVAFASAVASTPLLSLRPEGEGDSLRRTTVSSRTRSASRSTTKRRLESVERSVPSTESKPSSGAAAQTHRGSAGLDSTSGATLFESPRSIRRSSRNSRNSAASRSSRQSPSSSATTKGSACLAREGIARLTHGGTNLDSLSPSALAVDDSQSSRDSGRYAMPSLSSAPSSQSQRQTESSSYESSSELSSRSSAEGMSLPSRLQSQVVAAMPSQHTLTQGTISSGSTTDASQTQGNSPTQDDYSSTCSSHRCSHLSAPPADLDPSAASAADELAAPPLPPQPPSALFSPVALFASAGSSPSTPLAERPLSSQRSVGSSPSTDKADLVSLAAFGMPFSPPIQAPGAAQGAIRLGKEASSLKPSEVQKQTAAEGPPGVACVKPAAKFDEPRDEPPGASSDDSGSDDEAVPGAGGHRAKKGSKRKQPTKTIHHGPSALGSAQAGGGAYVDLRGNVAGQARSSGGEGSSGESSEASRDAAGDAYVSKWEAARRDRAAMQGGVVSQAEHTTLEVLLRWPAGAPLGLAQLALPAVVVRRYQHQRGIAEAHAWQVEALRAGGGGCWQRGDHLVYSAPTGGGKTLVAELLVLRRLFRGDACGTILWAVPLKALANEVAQKLSRLLEHLAVVKAFHGDDGGAKLSPKVKVAVCTYERANAIVNAELAQQLDEGGGGGFRGGLGGVSMVVVDEVHNFESNPVLERLLAKVAFANQQAAVGSNNSSQDGFSFGGGADDDSYGGYGGYGGNGGGGGDDGGGFGCSSNAVQVVACSATIPNAEAIAAWLHAACFATAVRTTALRWLAVGAYSSDGCKTLAAAGGAGSGGCPVYALEAPCSAAFAVAAAPARTLPAAAADPTGLVAACRETLTAGGSVLVFCNARYLTAKLATQLRKALRPHATNTGAPAAANTSADTTATAAPAAAAKLAAAREALAAEVVQACGSRAAAGLCAALRCGVGFHHAGLSQEEKALVEQGFRDRTLDLLCATTTLANGVNTPASRVVICSLIRHAATPYSAQDLKQMGGRAGRQGEGAPSDAATAGSVVVLLTVGNNQGNKKNSDPKSAFVRQILGHDQPPIQSSLLVPSASSAAAEASSSSSRGPAPTFKYAVDAALLETAVLEAIVLGLANTRPALLTYLHCFFAARALRDHATALAAEDGDDGGAHPLLDAALDAALAALAGTASGCSIAPLVTNTFEALVPEALGRAAAASLLAPRDARTLQRDFAAAACGGLVLESPLHLLCLVAPLDGAGGTPYAVDFKLLETHLVNDERHDDWGRVADAFVGPRWRGTIVARAAGCAGGSGGDGTQRFQRFWLALLLKHVIEEETAAGSTSSSSGRGHRRSFFAAVNLEAGHVQTLQRLAFEQCGKAVAFCQALGFDALASLLKPLKARLQFGVKKELLPLKALARDARATPALLRCVFDAGFTHPKKLLKPGAEPRLLHALASRRQTHYVEQDAGAAQRATAAHRADQALVAELVKAARKAEADRKRRPDSN